MKDAKPDRSPIPDMDEADQANGENPEPVGPADRDAGSESEPAASPAPGPR